MAAPIPALVGIAISKLQVRLVHQGCRLERLRSHFATHLLRRQKSKLVIELSQQRVRSRLC